MIKQAATLTNSDGFLIAECMLEACTPFIAITQDEDGRQYIGAYTSLALVPDAPHVALFHRNVSIRVDDVMSTLYVLEES